jgi:tetratricopeptide (TPR) repeat protein
VRRVIALASLVVLAAGAVAVVERLNADRRYRQLLAEGEQALSRGHTYGAIESFSGALALRPDSMVAFFRRGEAYGQQGQLETAVRDLRAARSLAPGARQPLEALGRVYERRGNHAESARWYAQAAGTLHDGDPDLLYALALARYRSGDPAGAREPLRLAIRSDDSMVRAHYLLGLVYRDSQETAEAIASLQQAIRLAPSFLPAREELADLYRSLNRPADERSQLAALAAADSRVERSIALALADVRDGQFESARLTLASMTAAAPGDSRIALALGRLHLARASLGSDEDAIVQAVSALESALGGTARRSEGLALYGRALFLSGDTAGAERLLREAVATTPVHPEAFAFLADAAEALHHPALARDALLSLDALEGDTVGPDVRVGRNRRIGALSLLSSDPAPAVRFLTFALAAGRTDPETLALLSRALWASGDRSGARATLAQGVAGNPDDPELQRLLRTFR